MSEKKKSRSKWLGLIVIIIGASVLGGMFAPWVQQHYGPKACTALPEWSDVFWVGYITTSNGTSATFTRADQIVAFTNVDQKLVGSGTMTPRLTHVIYLTNQLHQEFVYVDVTSYSMKEDQSITGTTTVCQ